MMIEPPFEPTMTAEFSYVQLAGPYMRSFNLTEFIETELPEET